MITAQEARNLINRDIAEDIEACIRQSAKGGVCYIEYYYREIQEEQCSKACKTLKNNGFEVSLGNNNIGTFIIVRW